MTSQTNQVGSFVVGGFLLGFWLYWAMIENPTWGAWGAVGIAIAAALYGAAVARDYVRIALFVIIGIFLGSLLAASFLQELDGIMATILTALGGGLIVSALPRGSTQQWQAAPDQ